MQSNAGTEGCDRYVTCGGYVGDDEETLRACFANAFRLPGHIFEGICRFLEMQAHEPAHGTHFGEA